MKQFQSTPSLPVHWRSGLPRDREWDQGGPADEAEALAGEQIQKRDGERLADWAGEPQQRRVTESQAENPPAIKHLKKSEVVYHLGPNGGGIGNQANG